jgi:hypothetical protein
VAIAIFVPNLEQIMVSRAYLSIPKAPLLRQPLVGFSGGVFLAFVFPPLIDLFTFLPILIAEQRHWTVLASRLAINGCFLAVGLLGSVAGLRASLVEILAKGK